MNKLTTDQKYDRFKYTIYESSSNILGKSNEQLLSVVFEDLAIDIYCYCCDNNIKELLDEFFINEEIAKKSIELRTLFRNIERGNYDRNVMTVKTDTIWAEFRAQADLVLTLIEKFEGQK